MELWWNEEMVTAFNLAKEAGASATWLAHPHADATTDFTLNVSGVAVGAAFKQLVNG